MVSEQLLILLAQFYYFSPKHAAMDIMIDGMYSYYSLICSDAVTDLDIQELANLTAGDADVDNFERLFTKLKEMKGKTQCTTMHNSPSCVGLYQVFIFCVGLLYSTLLMQGNIWADTDVIFVVGFFHF